MKDTLLKIIPEGVNILIQLNPVREHKTEGGIVLPDTHGEESRIGIIIAVGNEVDKRHKPGDKVLISFVMGTPLHFPDAGILDDTVRIITQSNIMAKIEE